MVWAEANEQADVLLVDDDKDVLDFLDAYLRSEGYRCELASNGRDAFRKANHAVYSLVVMDLLMPDWDGLDAIVSLSLVNPNQRVLVLSGALNPELETELSSCGNVVGCLGKPFNLKTLSGFVAAAVKERKAAPAS